MGGCIAGGRNYCHINPNGDVEPCVFIHYSGANIREVSLLDALKQPLFMAYREDSPLTITCFVPARCWKTPSCCARWCTRRGPTTRICSRRRHWTTCVISARLTRRAGSPWRMRSGPAPKSKRAATRTIRIGNPV
ncbi:MAG: SPASM domain-containing protein [Faecalibacterium sp.]